MKKETSNIKKKFNPGEFEKKWQEYWEDNAIFSPDMDEAKRPYYNLMMFPYPSAEGMHVGNMYAHTGADIHGRFKRMQGFDVFEPIGLDGFGIHSENYAMKVGRHPKEQTQRAQENFYRQMHETGSAFDWKRTVETYDAGYYKWTQWIFTEMFKAGLAYRKKAMVNYCPSCKTVLSDEQVIAGACERCGTMVERRELEQWFFRITKHAGRLLDNIANLDWTEKVKIAQTNWIGRSKGSLITFPIADFRLRNGEKPNFVLLHGFGGSPRDNFFPAVKRQLEQVGFEVQVPELPNSDNPTEEEQVSYVLENMKFDECTILYGHSLGSVVAMKVVEKLKKPIAGLVLSGTFTKPEFLDHERPFANTFTWKFDAEKIKSSTGFVKVIHDTHDDAVPFERAKEVAEMLGVGVTPVMANSPHFDAKYEPEIIKALVGGIDVFTTRPDTLFGATFIVISPEHPIVKRITGLEFEVNAETVSSLKEYEAKAAQKSETERLSEDKDKTGVFSGIYALNPSTGGKIPVWVADYVLGGYGTGAIMAVPGHDARDFQFAKKYDLPITHVIMPSYVDEINPPQEGKENTKRTVIIGIVRDPKTNKYLILDWKEQGWKTFITGGVEEGEDIVEAAKREIAEETGYTDLRLVRELGGPTEAFFYAAHKGVNRQTKGFPILFELESDTREKVSTEESQQHEAVWMSEEEVIAAGLRHGEFNLLWERIQTGIDVYVGSGLLQNSGSWNGWHCKRDFDKVLEFISDQGWGRAEEQYHLRDWLISRQRYWGPPIPMLFCQACADAGRSWFSTQEAGNRNQKLGSSSESAGWYPVSTNQLPVLLPDIEDFKPLGTGKAPLANHPEFYETTCPECGGKAVRETDVSDVFLDSAWYFLRYTSTEKDDVPFVESRVKTWLPVDIYIGGAEHSVLHLLYARFVTMVLHDLGYTDFEEPFTKFVAHGLLIKEGSKMSKSKGNVINPDEYIEKYGADTLRTYLMFLGPFNQGGDFYDTGIEGMYRFLRRVWVLLTSRVEIGAEEDAAVTRVLHKTIKGVTTDMESFGYNTSIAKLMELYNALADGKTETDTIQVRRNTVEAFLKMFAPFAPHMTEELWHRFSGFGSQLSDVSHSVSQSAGSSDGQTDKQINNSLKTENGKQTTNYKSIHLSPWPTYDESQLEENEVVVVIQVNGKRRGEFVLAKQEAQNQTVAEEKAKVAAAKYLAGQTVKKVIYVPGKIINFVI
jgi:leucyl-tRNA synthetase